MCVWPSLKLCCVHSKQLAGTALAAAQILRPPSKQARGSSLSPALPLLNPLEPEQGHSPGSEGAAGCPSRDSELRQGPLQCCTGAHPHPSHLPSHTVRKILFSSTRTSPQWGINFILHLTVTALILGLSQCKFRQALAKTLFLSPFISPATHCQPYR